MLIINCHFISNSYVSHLFLFASSKNGSVQFINCQFIDNKLTYKSLWISPSLIKLNQIVKIELFGCNFYASSSYPAQVLQTHGNNTDPATTQVVIKTTNFTYYGNHTFRGATNFISLLHTTLLLEGSVAFLTFLLTASFSLKEIA